MMWLLVLAGVLVLPVMLAACLAQGSVVATPVPPGSRPAIAEVQAPVAADSPVARDVGRAAPASLVTVVP